MKAVILLAILLDIGFSVVRCADLPVLLVGASECQEFDSQTWRVIMDDASVDRLAVNVDVEILDWGELRTSGPRPCTPILSEFGGHPALVCAGRGLINVRYDVLSVNGMQTISLGIGRRDAVALTSVDRDAYPLEFSPSYVNVTWARSPVTWVAALCFTTIGYMLFRFRAARRSRRAHG